MTNLVFCRIKSLIGNIHDTFGIPNLPQSPDIGPTQTGVFPISAFLVKLFTNKSCHKSRTSDDIDVKLRPVTKLDKGNTTTLKEFDSNTVSTNYHTSVIFSD